MIKSIREVADGLLGIRRCPFCIEPAPRLGKCQNADCSTVQGLSCYWHCPQCEGDFCIEADFLEPIYPPPSRPSAAYTAGASSTSFRRSDTKTTYSNGLCPRCNHYQETMIHLLLAYEGPKPDVYRQELERSRYPLCAACQFAVQQRLKRVTYQVKAKQIKKQGPEAKAVRPGIVPELSVAMLAAALWVGGLVAICSLWHGWNRRYRRMLLVLACSALAPDALVMAAAFLSVISANAARPSEAAPTSPRPTSLSNLRLSNDDPPVSPIMRRPVFPIVKPDPLPGALRPTPLPPTGSSPGLESMLASFSLSDDASGPRSSGRPAGGSAPAAHYLLRGALVAGRVAMWHFRSNWALALFAVHCCVLPVRRWHVALCVLRSSSACDHPMLALAMDAALLLL